ncbi:phosphatidate cytidylyltransferase [Spirillospora sp. NPDC047279]|uniref:phosphatidate cytidylyltransferase n=1 Tax=Spirillospora sp. NPDC047279 TaxID=3155478 RepID=UPI0033ED334A
MELDATGEPAGSPDEPKAPDTPPPAHKRTGRNLPAAIAVGAALGALVLLSLYTVKAIFLVVMVVFLFIGLHELAGAFKSRDVRVALPPLAAGLVAATVTAYGWGPEPLVAVTALTVLAVLIWRMADGPPAGYVRDVTAGVFITGYVVLMAGIVALIIAPDDGDHRIVIFIATTVASDIGGYFAGTFLGRHKLVPSISPKKTWEGAAGSILVCMLVGGWLVAWLLDGHLWEGALIGAAVAIIAIAGDLIVSMVKRDLGLKDMGTLLPGHGGVMDRLDSLIATAPVVWVLLELLTPST